MRWAQFLHLYQPHYQQPDVLERIVGRSYRPIIEGLIERPQARTTINVNAILLELLHDHGYDDLIDKLGVLGQRGQVEFLGSAKYHTLLPFLPESEVRRQITLNTQTARHFLGEAFRPKGIFLPEMAFDPWLVPVLEDLGFAYVLVDELGYNGQAKAVRHDERYRAAGHNLRIIFRERRVSNAIMHGAVRDVAALAQAADDLRAGNQYLVTGMDGEVFGWHHPGHEQLLFAMLEAPELGMGQVQDLLDGPWPLVEVAPQACSWADSQHDLAENKPFYSWRDPGNPLQQLEWQLQALTLAEFAKLAHDDPAWKQLRAKLDPALASDVFFWSSARPWWSIELIEEGAFGLYEVVRDSPASSAAAKARAEHLYRQIMDTAFDWRRSGKIAAIVQERADILRIPFKERSDTATYEAFVELMGTLRDAAAAQHDYETAALWRDALYKLDHKSDAYDSYHVIDMLRARLPNATIEATIARYQEQYHDIRGGQPEQRSN